MIVVFQRKRVNRRVHPQTLTYRDPVPCRARDRSHIPLLSLILHRVILTLITGNVLLNIIVEVVLVVVGNVIVAVTPTFLAVLFECGRMAGLPVSLVAIKVIPTLRLMLHLIQEFVSAIHTFFH